MAASFFLVILLFVCKSAIAAAEKPIAYKSVKTYTLIWNDAGSGAKRDVSYWQVTDQEYNYFSLGDAVTASHSKPSLPAVMVKELQRGALARPQSFQEIWNDRGSGANSDVKIMRMVPPSGYTCLSNVVVRGYSTNPDRNRYRCVKSSYVTRGQLTEVWNDRGSGASRDVSNWEVIRGSGLDGIEASCFLSVAAHRRPSDTPYLLSNRYVTNHLMLNDVSKAKIKLYQASSVDMIWYDRGSGARRDFSCWRPKGPAGTFSLGDMPQSNYNRPRGLVARELEEGALRPPSYYRQRWTDRGSGANWDGAFWEPICPNGYVALGHVCTRGYNQPSTNDMRCVRYDLVSRGRWVYVWNDRGSGARQDGAAYRAVPQTNAQQGVQGMGTMGNHNAMDRTAYVLIGSKTIYVANKPVKRYIIEDITYDIKNPTIISRELSTMATQTVVNHGATPQKSSVTLTGSWSKSSSWTHTVGFEIGVSVTTKAGIPLIGSSEVTVSAKSSYSYQTGGSTTKQESVSYTADVVTQGRHSKKVTLVGYRYKADVSYTATVTTEYTDGTRDVRRRVTGTFNGVSVSDQHIVYGKDIPIPN
eukprot:GHVU01135478.1.p1 GENE.GHVU01135478.1~~GHVU01135478.1.p1  ORF type:complete len:585 (+),score=34.59 GHVU01135478.1:41-1795(+)